MTINHMKWVVLFLLCPALGHSQVLTGETTGNTSVLYQGVGLGFKVDAKNPAITFNLNNFSNDKLKNDDKPFVWGISASSKSEEGIADIFNAGDLSTSFNGSLLIGYSFVSKKLSKRIKEKYVLAKNRLDGKPLTANGLREAMEDNDVQTLDDLKSELRDNEQLSALEEERGYWLNRFTIFADAGFSNTAFKAFDSINNVDFAKSFTNKQFQGFYAHLGVNVHLCSQFILGLKGGLKYTNNLQSLKSTEYKITTTNSNTGQTMESEKKITAYKGSSYYELMTYPVMMDAVGFFSVTDSVSIAVNVYGRQNFSSNKIKLPHTTTVGVGAYFFKSNRSNFLGGLYVELPDVFNNIAKADPEANQRKVQNRLTFGIAAKYTFSSLFSYQ